MSSEKLVTWGAVLIMFGLLSFVLPMFGRQFLLLTAFGGGTGIGLILIVIGGVMVFSGIKSNKDF